jgi:hypothetical protein
MPNEHVIAAIDPMALILSEKWYLIWTEIHHPHVELNASLEKVFERATPHERAEAAARAEKIAGFAAAVKNVTTARV